MTYSSNHQIQQLIYCDVMNQHTTHPHAIHNTKFNTPDTSTVILQYRHNPIAIHSDNRQQAATIYYQYP